MVMKTRTEGNKTIYEYRAEKSDGGGIKLAIGTGFNTPDSDGIELKTAMDKIKNGKVVTVTIKVEKVKPTVECLKSDGIWSKSLNLQKAIDSYPALGQDDKYMYSYHGTMLYRTKLMKE